MEYQTKARLMLLTAVTATVLVGAWGWSIYRGWKPVPAPTTMLSTANWSRRFCDEPVDPKIADHTTDKETPVIKFTLQEGCYASEYKLPNVNWSGSEEAKSRQEGDWASVWCEGRQNPSRIYFWYEDFKSEFQSCRVFALQGKGWISFRRNY